MPASTVYKVGAADHERWSTHNEAVYYRGRGWAAPAPVALLLRRPCAFFSCGPAMDAGSTAREFSIYYGFLEPLQVLDDRALLTRMAHLKQRAISPRISLRTSTTPMSPMTPTRSSTTVAAVPASPCGCVTPTSRPSRPARPRTAPAGGRGFHVRAPQYRPF